MRSSIAMAIGLVATITAGRATALINPNFTPIHVVEQSAMIAVLDVPQKMEGKQISLPVAATLKGDSKQKSVILDLSTANPPEQAAAMRVLLAASSGRQALLFAGEYVEQPELGEGGYADGGYDPGGYAPESGAADKQVEAQAFLHVSARWIALYVGEEGQYQVSRIDDHMEATWAGGTDMLDRAVRYILTDEDPEVPSVSGVSWGTTLKITALEGKVTGARPVWLKDERHPYLFLACDRGDRLFRFDPQQQQFDDVTAERKLESKSLVSTWGDLNGNGRPDLASWDGESLVLHIQNREGEFRQNILLSPDRLKEPCIGLAMVDGGAAARAVLAISTPTAPRLILVKDDHSAELKTLSTNEVDIGDFGPAGPCLVADFDGDLLPDLLQPFAKGSLLYKGNDETVFADPLPCALALGPGTSAAFLGDYDGDGQFDVLTVADDRPRLWHNRGAGNFVDTRDISGEIAYISQPRGVSGTTGDFNNDGRQDVLLLYSDREPQLFFNRGFRSFGHARALNVHEQDLPVSAEGQQAGCLAEFSGYGAQDMVLVLNNGEVWAMLRDEEYDDGLYAGVSLAAVAPFLGPLRVTAETDGRNLGAWNVSPGLSTAFFGRWDSGPCTIKWQLPGGEPQRKEIILEDRPVWVSVK